MAKYSEFEFRTQPWFDQDNFEGFNKAIPMKTIVIHCFDPRAAEIPQAVAEYFPGEVYPGENVLDASGNRVGSTRTLFQVSNAGGRAAEALQTIAIMDYLFSVENVVVVHHSFCGATAFRTEQFFDRYQEHHHADISKLFDHGSIAINDFEESVRYDVNLLRASPAVPKRVKLYGFFFDINTRELTEIVRDVPA
jgi:carbonic anhydrase